MSTALLIGIVLLVLLAVSLWIDYSNARAQFAPLAPVGWLYHFRVRWWLTPQIKIDLFLFAVAAGWVAWAVWT